MQSPSPSTGGERRGGRRPMQHQQTGGQVAALLNPVRGYRDELRRAGKTPTDHARRNLRRIRDTERRIQEQREEQEQAKQAKPVPFKMQQFAQVQPRTVCSRSPGNQAEDSEASAMAAAEGDSESGEGRGAAEATAGKGASPPPSSGPRKSFLRKGDRCQTTTLATAAAEALAPSTAATTGRSSRRRESLKQAVPRASELNQLAPRGKTNYIKSNLADVHSKDEENRAKEQLQRDRERAAEEEAARHAEFGHVPRYLVQRQTELMRQEARNAEASDPDCPPGMVRYPEADRLRTLQSLRQGARDLQDEIRKFPLASSSVAQRRRKKDLEDRLVEQEEAVAIFSKDKVFVHEET